MSNQVFSNKTDRYFTKSYSFTEMLITIPVNFNQFLITNGMSENTWIQLGGNVTKNGCTCSNGPSTNYMTEKSIYGATFNSDRGEMTIFHPGTYEVSIGVTIKRSPEILAGDRDHYIGISKNDTDPVSFCSGYGISDNTLLSLGCTEVMTLVKGDRISINYAQNEGQDEIWAKYNLTVKEIYL